MNRGTDWSIKNVRLTQVMPLIVATATIGFASPAMAAGTVAGTNIQNTATATFDDTGGNPQSVNSNTVSLRVDELLDVTVASADPGDVQTVPGSTNQVLTFTVTNTGNGSEAFTLTPNATLGGDQYDPTVTSLVLDTNNNGVYDPGVDTVYTAGTNDPVLAPDASIKVFVLSTTPAGTVDGNRGQVNLTAEANTALAGANTPGTSYAGLGQGGGDAVVGATGADGVDKGFYIVQNATIAFVKTQSVLDPFGGSKVVPGSVVTYTLVATISGTGTLTNVVIGDNIPANTTYQNSSIVYQTVAQSDASDADAGRFEAAAAGPPATPARIRVNAGAVPAGQTRTVTFRVVVN
jgi:uncharacterized repeat protein (TIGR01451 family)